jgi:uncharacterized protein involved in cysteine biosynthesis
MITPVRTAYSKAHTLIWKEGNWRYLLLPIGLSVIIALALVGLCGAVSLWIGSWLQDWLATRWNAPGWIQAVATAVLFVVGLAPSYILFRSAVLFCYSPFLDRLSRKAELAILGEVKSGERGVAESLGRLLLMAALTISASAVVTVAGLLLGWIPVVGWGVVAVLFPVQMFLSALSYLDPYLERRGYSPMASLRLMRKHFGSVLIFGVVGFFINLIPIVGWFVGPTYSVVAGIVLGILITEKTPE